MSVPAAVVHAAHASLRQHGRSFALAGWLLPRALRDDAALLYAFCRLVDDTADEAPDRAAALAGLDAIEAELAGRRLARPLVAAYFDVCARRGIPSAAGAELLRGVRGDLGDDDGRVVVADDAELLRYAYRVAGTVGLMMSGVLGVRDPRALAQAIDLGVAMQLTNISRDVREDAARGRVYLPAERLRAHGVSSGALLRLADREGAEAGASDGAVVREAVAAVVGELLALAERYYQSAAGAMAAIPLRGRLAIAAAARIYRAIGTRLRRRHRLDAWHGRTRVPAVQRLWQLALGVGFALVLAPWLRRPHDAALHGALRGLPGCAPPAAEAPALHSSLRPAPGR